MKEKTVNVELSENEVEVILWMLKRAFYLNDWDSYINQPKFVDNPTCIGKKMNDATLELECQKTT